MFVEPETVGYRYSEIEHKTSANICVFFTRPVHNKSYLNNVHIVFNLTRVPREYRSLRVTVLQRLKHKYSRVNMNFKSTHQ